MGVQSISLFGQTYPFDIESWSTFGWFSSSESPEGDVITDHKERGKKLLLEQFRHKDKIDKLLDAYIEPFQELEFVADDTLKLTRLDASAGQQVDNIAQYAGLERNGLEDTEYKQAIKTKILLNTSNGEVETIILAAQFLTGSETIYLNALFPARISITVSGLIPNFSIKNAIYKVMAAGVGLILSYIPPNLKLLGYAQEGVLPSLHTGLLKENNVDSSATDGYLSELILY